MKNNLHAAAKDRKVHGKYVNIAVAMMVTAILFFILGICSDIVYCLNDDLMIQSILSGRYSGVPSGKAVYLSEPLSSLLAFLYTVLPSLPWLGLFLAGCYAICFFLALYAALDRLTKDAEFTGKRRIIGIGCVCVFGISVFYGFFLSQFLMIHYTVAASVVGGTAIYLFLMSDESREWKTVLKSTWIPVVLLLFCYLIRTKVFFMVLPFLAVAGLYRILRTKSFVPYLIPLSVLGAGILLLMLVGRLCYKDAAWREYLEYNDARTELYDYGKIWEEEEAAEYYAGQGYTPEEMAIYREYNVLLNEALTAEDYRKIAAYGGLRPEGQRTLLQKIREGFWLYRHRMFGKTEDYPYNIVSIAFYIMAALAMIGVKDKKSLWMIVLLGVVRSCLWVYLLAEGRYPERITVSLYLIEFFVLLAMMTDALRKMLSIGSIVNRIGAALAGICFLILVLETGYQVLPEALGERARQLETNKEEGRVFDLMRSHPENLYLLDVYAVVYHTEYAVRDYDGAYENYLLLGGWAAGSPLVTEKLDGWGYRSAFDALERGENVYLVLKDGVGMSIQELEDFYFWRTGKTAVFQQVETSDGGFCIYQKISG